MIDIILLSYNLSDLTVRCLETIREHTEDYRVILIDNDSRPEEFKNVLAELKNHEHILLRNNHNLGFVKGVNQGLCLSTAEYVVLMNNDTEAVTGWSRKLMEPLRNGHGVSGSRTDAQGSWQGRCEPGEGILTLKPGSMLAFFCTMFKREVIEVVGFLDEAFGMGFGDDDDYCARVDKAGFKLCLVQNLLIPHKHRATWKSYLSQDEIKKRQEINLNIFKEKHQCQNQ